MKTFLNLKQYLILFAAIFSLTSCLKSDDPAFQIAATGYINQVVSENSTGEGENVTITSEFTPILYVYGNEQISNCTVTMPGSLMSTKKLDDYGMVWLSEGVVPSDKLPTDAIAISAANAEGDGASFSMSFTSAKEMKTKLISPIACNPETKELTFEFNKVENATEYLVVVRESRSATLYQSVVVESYTESEISKGKLSLAEATYAKNLAAGTYIFTTIAITGTSSNAYFGVIQEGSSVSYTKAE